MDAPCVPEGVSISTQSGHNEAHGCDEWELEKGASDATDEEMQHHATSEPTTEDTILDLGIPGSASWRGVNDTAAIPKTLMWSAEEELVVSTTAPPGHIGMSLGR